MKDEKELSDEELGAITALMREYVIPTPDEQIIDQTVNTLTHLMKSTKAKRNPFRTLMQLLESLAHVMQYSGKWYVAFCLVLYSAALAITLSDDNINLYVPSMILGPIPFLLAVVDAFRSSEARMAELEMSLKYSLKQLMMAKFLLAAIFNTVCNVLMSLVLSETNPGFDPVRLALCWCAPFLFVSSVSLYIVIKIRGFYVSLGCLGIWSGLSFLIAFNPDWTRFLTMYVKTELYAVIAVVSCLILIYDITVLLSKTIERGDFFDTYTKEHIKTI